MRFIDLFAGLGGFHQALERLGHECVFASELDSDLAELYELNFSVRPKGDIRATHEEVPPHDILCAGFPCQPFSKAGDQKGFDCPQWGDLFDFVLKIIERHEPAFLIIENVPNLLRHDGGATWARVRSRLEGLGYDIDANKLSPHMLGVPQTRERAIIVGARNGLGRFHWPTASHAASELHVSSILDQQPSGARRLPDQFIQYLEAWQALLDALPVDQALPSFPIWAMEFGATYPFRAGTPTHHGLEDIRLRLVGGIELGEQRIAIRIDLRTLHPEVDEGSIITTAQIGFVRTGQRVRIVIAPDSDDLQRPSNLAMVKLVVQAITARNMITAGASLVEAVERLKMTRAYLIDLLRVSYLAPSIISAIMEGRQPTSLSRKRLVQACQVPLRWEEQWRAFGFA